MWGRTLGLALVAAAGAAIAWKASQPYLPYASAADMRIESLHSLGTFYGTFGSALLGALVCGPLAFLIAKQRTTLVSALVSLLLGCVLGGALVCGANALSDVFNIQLEKAGIYVNLAAADWFVLVAAAMAFSVALACRPSLKRLKRAVVATGWGATLGFLLRLLLVPFETAFVVGKALSVGKQQLEHLNLWALYSPSQLAQQVSMAFVMGLVLGFIEHRACEAWLRRVMGHGEGRDYSLERQITRIGSKEGVEVLVRNDPMVKPLHAQIARQQSWYCVTAIEGPIAVNGQLVPGAFLKAGDLITVGQASLMFMEKSPSAFSPPLYVPQVQAQLAQEVPASQSSAAAIQPSSVPISPLLECATLSKPLALGKNPLGRDPALFAPLASDQAVSRRHAEIVLTADSVVLRDLGSSNGTFVNGVKIVGDHELRSGDAIQLGSTQIVYRCG